MSPAWPWGAAEPIVDRPMPPGDVGGNYSHISLVAAAISSQKHADRAVSRQTATRKRVLGLWTELGTARGRASQLGAAARLSPTPVQR